MSRDDTAAVEHDWQPSATRDVLVARAELLARIRAYFAHHDVLEVETPALSAAAVTDPALHSLSTTLHGPGASGGARRFLHTSPEFAMKRLLAAGSGDIYQLCKVFRDEEQGAHHSPEFSLLEWYRTGYDHLDLMDDVERLLTDVLAGLAPLADVSHWTYRNLFIEFAGLDPFATDREGIVDCLRRHRVGIPAGMDADADDAWFDLLLTHVIEPRMGKGLLFVTDFPADQASLARLRPGNPPVASRFEAWLDGVEIANGFHELADAGEQRGRFEQDLEQRRRLGLERVPLDERLLAALDAGLPDCAGVAVGIDRLLMVALGSRSIDEVQAFSAGSA